MLDEIDFFSESNLTFSTEGNIFTLLMASLIQVFLDMNIFSYNAYLLTI
jgi:hypothetical protein